MNTMKQKARGLHSYVKVACGHRYLFKDML